MLRAVVAALTVLMLTAVLVGCGGPENGVTPPTPPPDGGGAAPVQVGPLLVRPASAAGFVAEEIPNPNGFVSLVALHGSRITYLASQAYLDRIVFAREQSGLDYDIWTCNLDGSNTVRLLNNAHGDADPVWSPHGRRIAFARMPTGQDSEIVVMNADGSGAYALTNNGASDITPTWSPTGERIAFCSDRTGDPEIFAMYTDGTGTVNLTNNAAVDSYPDWSPRLEDPRIAFSTDRDGNLEIYRMGPTGDSPTRLTNNPEASNMPAFDAGGNRIAFQQQVTPGFADLWVTYAGGGTPYAFAEEPGPEKVPTWSSDDRFICYVVMDGADQELVLRETAQPYRTYRLTDNAVHEGAPDLGSPTLQTDRVIIGPAGSDWGGYNPIWSSCDAGIAAYDADGYRNFVRIGIAAADLPTLSIEPLAIGALNGYGASLGVVVKAAEIVNLREDGGRGETPVLWQLDPLDPTAVLLYFNGSTGKLVAALVLRDQNYPAGAGAGGAGISERAEGDAAVVEGAFAAVFDATGARVADAASTVRIGEDGVMVLR